MPKKNSEARRPFYRMRRSCLFNEGVVQLQQGDADSATQSFQEALNRALGKNPKLAGRASSTWVRR